MATSAIPALLTAFATDPGARRPVGRQAATASPTIAATMPTEVQILARFSRGYAWTE